MSEDTPDSTYHDDQTITPQTDSNKRTVVDKDTSPSTSSSSADKTRSRANETSPTRQSIDYSTVPSAAAVQRALAHRAQPASLDGILEGTRDRAVRSGPNSPSWPTSPRLKSPPPSVRNSVSKKTDPEQTLSNTAKRLSPNSNLDAATAISIPEPTKSNPRPSGRGVSAQNPALETVAEGSIPSPSTVDPSTVHKDTVNIEKGLEEQHKEIANGYQADLPSKPDVSKTENEQQSRASSVSRPGAGLAKKSITSLTAKNKAEPMRTMTVETEPVTSMPQLLGDRNRDGGSVRTKPSNETIRPRKERKKASRKPPSLHAGTGTSKADIFEAKVASAVDEADTSDSDETFVYESNPPEPRANRHHSRTPSATSQLSSADPYGGRHKHGIRGGGSAISGKKSMKFSNSGHREIESDGQNGTRGSSRTASSTPRHHQIGRHGRNGHTSILDQDSPFTQAGKSSSPRLSTGNLARTSATNSRSNSPKFSNGKHPTSPRKYGEAAYDNFEDAADDERAPLMGSVRVNRNRHSRRPHSRDFRSMEWSDDKDTTCWSRFGGCIVLVLLVTLICIGVATFIVALNRPLMEVEIKRIQNVLASEQELMLDLEVRAVNPNLFAITVNNLDVNIFAESPYVGTANEWNKEHSALRKSLKERRLTAIQEKSWFPFPPFHPDDGVDEGTDPIDEEPLPGNQKMLLGRIFEFDSPLVFDATPIRRIPTTSVGEIRLQRPGNKTEVGGSARWERVLQHPFDLIVRGVIKYQLPLSSKIRSAKLSGRKEILPDTGGGDDKNTTKWFSAKKKKMRLLLA